MHEFLGGIRIGDSSCNAINYSYPFTKVVFTENALQLSIGVFFLKKRYFLPYYAITGVSLKKGIVCRGINKASVKSYSGVYCFLDRKI